MQDSNYYIRNPVELSKVEALRFMKIKLSSANNFVQNVKKSSDSLLHEIEIRLEQLLGLMDNSQEILSKSEEIFPLGSLSKEHAEWEAFGSFHFFIFTMALYKRVLNENRLNYAKNE